MISLDRDSKNKLTSGLTIRQFILPKTSLAQLSFSPEPTACGSHLNTVRGSTRPPNYFHMHKFVFTFTKVDDFSHSRVYIFNFSKNTVEHDFNGHEVNGIHGVYGKKCYCRAFHLVNKLHDFNGMHDLSGNFCYDDFFCKTHARLYYQTPKCLFTLRHDRVLNADGYQIVSLSLHPIK